MRWVAFAPSGALLLLLLFVLIYDLKHFKIRNNAVTALFVIAAIDLLVNDPVHTQIAHAVFALVMSGLLLLFYLRGGIGGGDIKLLSVSFLSIGPENALLFCLMQMAFTLVFWLAARFDGFPSRPTSNGTALPFAPAIASSWAIIVIMRVVGQS